MTETPPDPEPYAWLPSATVLDWLGLKAGVDDADKLADAERARQAAADYCEDQRPDLWIVDADNPPIFDATPKIVQAGKIAAARIYARRKTPTGLVNYGDFAAGVLRIDPDVAQLLGIGKYAPPAVG